MEINEFFKQLGVDKNIINEENNEYIVELQDSDEFATIYTRLSKLDNIDLIQTLMDEAHSMSEYMSDDYDITLSADFDKDIYKLVVEMVED